MKHKKKGLLLLLITTLILIIPKVHTGQSKADSIAKELRSLTDDVPALNERVSITLSNVPLSEYLRAVANNTSLNLNVDPGLNMKVSNNFSNVKVIDILIFFQQQYNLKINYIGNIFSITEETKAKDSPQGIMDIVFEKENDLLSVNCENQDLNYVLKEIVKETGNNIIMAPGLKNTKVHAYIRKMTFRNALEKFAYTNGLKVERDNSNTFIIKSAVEKRKDHKKTTVNKYSDREQVDLTQREDVEISLNTEKKDSLAVYAVKVPIVDLIKTVSDRVRVNYFLSSEIEGLVSLNISGVTYEDLLKNLLNGTPYIYKKENGIYLIGEKKIEELKNYELVKLQHRTTDTIVNILPDDMVEELDIKEFPDLNSLVIAGSQKQVKKVKAFIKELDKSVPVVLIEVMIIDFNKTDQLQTGLNMGVGDMPGKGTGQVFPSVDFKYSTESINSLIESFNGFGWVNIGKVSQNFYMNLKALESIGVLNVRSTPKLSTLNGHSAKMSIGNKEYYLEKQNNIIGTQTPQVAQQETYKSVQAELAVQIKPVISGDNQITMMINVKQSDFTERISDFAPPGTVTRNFESTIRVKNQEMVLLGGLEEKRKDEQSQGVPILSKIPILKWIFSSKNNKKSESRLNIFIKPTIIN